MYNIEMEVLKWIESLLEKYALEKTSDFIHGMEETNDQGLTIAFIMIKATGNDSVAGEDDVQYLAATANRLYQQIQKGGTC